MMRLLFLLYNLESKQKDGRGKVTLKGISISHGMWSLQMVRQTVYRSQEGSFLVVLEPRMEQ